MRINVRTSTKIVAASMLVIGCLVGGEAVLAFQGHMFAARNDLREARAQLITAIPDKAGHRVNAINLVNQALGEVNQGIAAGAQ